MGTDSSISAFDGAEEECLPFWGADLKIDFHDASFHCNPVSMKIEACGRGVARLHGVVLLFSPGFLNLLQIKLN